MTAIFFRKENNIFLYVRFAPFVIFSAVLFKYIFAGEAGRLLSIYRDFILIHGDADSNLLFYFISSLFVVVYPIKKWKVRVIDVFFITICIFYLFQTEYYLITQISTRFLDITPTYFNPYMSLFMMCFWGGVIFFSNLSRLNILYLNIIVLFLASISSYHTYFIIFGFMKSAVSS